MTLAWLPNLITLLRLILLLPLTWLLASERWFEALVVFFIAGFSDGLDGFLAKRFGWVSRFGAIMDPLADKALLGITFFLLTLKGYIHWPLFAVVVFRDLYIISGAWYYHHRLGPYQMAPSLLSKLNTFTQLLLVSSHLFSVGYLRLPDWYLFAVTLATWVTTLSSGVHYTWVWGRKYRTEMAARREEHS